MASKCASVVLFLRLFFSAIVGLLCGTADVLFSLHYHFSTWKCKSQVFHARFPLFSFFHLTKGQVLFISHLKENRLKILNWNFSKMAESPNLLKIYWQFMKTGLKYTQSFGKCNEQDMTLCTPALRESPVWCETTAKHKGPSPASSLREQNGTAPFP